VISLSVISFPHISANYVFMLAIEVPWDILYVQKVFYTAQTPPRVTT